MTKEDKEVFAKGRQYIVGIVALVFALRRGPSAIHSPAVSFDLAEDFVEEFERRNECQSG